MVSELGALRTINHFTVDINLQLLTSSCLLDTEL